MKKCLLLFSFLLLSILAAAQFEQKISLNLAGGVFKTFGKKVGEYEPMQMPNYGMGFSANLGLQFKIVEQFSLSVEFGYMSSHRWDYHEGDNNSFLYWSILDSITFDLLEEGYNYLDIHNYSIGIKPKLYLTQGKKWNPYLFAGVNINWTRAWFENSWWIAADNLGYLPKDDTGPYNGNLEQNFGLGFNPGFGIEYSPGDKISFNLSSGYYLIMLNKNNFKSPSREEHFNAFVLQAGVRYNFIKSKDL
jgi:opacity protein-like surface antigen